jgi:hypothetical protein
MARFLTSVGNTKSKKYSNGKMFENVSEIDNHILGYTKLTKSDNFGGFKVCTVHYFKFPHFIFVLPRIRYFELKFCTLIDSTNYQVIYSAESTCMNVIV